MFGPAERWLGVDDPVLLEKLSQKPAKTAWLGETLERTLKLELVGIIPMPNQHWT